MDEEHGTREARARLEAAKAEYDAAKQSAENTRLALYHVVQDVAPVLKQVEIVKTTGWTREHIRQIVERRQEVSRTSDQPRTEG